MILRNELRPLTINGDLRRGGWLATGRVEGDTDLVARGDNWVIDGKSLTSFVDSDWRAALDAHILADPDYNFERYGSVANVQSGTADAFLRGESVQDISFADVASPANSHEATSWNFAEVVEHILQHHCNYIYDATGAAGSPDGWITTTDLDTTNSTTFEVFIVNQSNNLWRTLQQIGGGEEGGGEFYRIWCTRQNVIKYQSAPPFISPQPAVKGTLTEDNIRGAVRVTLHNSMPGERVGQVQLSAVANPTTVYNSTYPTNPEIGKIFKKDSGVWAQSQARADVLSERLYRWLTRSYTLQVEVDPGLILWGDDGAGLDLGDRVAMTFDGPALDTETGAGVHLNLSAQSLFVYGATVRYDEAGRAGSGMLILEHDNS